MQQNRVFWVSTPQIKKSPNELNAKNEWLSDWVLPLLFSLLTLACLMLLAVETLTPPGSTPLFQQESLSGELAGKQPVVISAFSG